MNSMAQMQTGPNIGPTAPMFSFLCMGIVFLAAIAFNIWIFGSIAKKAGYSFWMGLLMLVPLANLVVMIMFALTKWPIEQELEHYRRQVGHYGGGQGFPVQQMPPQMPPR